MHDKAASPTDNFRKMFPAQVIKDASMAHRTVKLLEQEDESSKDKYLLLMGTGHMGYGFGVPERIFAKKPEDENKDKPQEEDGENSDGGVRAPDEPPSLQLEDKTA